MVFTLTPHPETPCTEVSGISVSVARDDELLTLDWRIEGDIAALAIPEAATPARTDGLWQHLCVELFVKDGEGPGYTEYNFAPSGQWAAYQFDDYRVGMRELEVIYAPETVTEIRTNLLCVRAKIDVNGIQTRSPEPVGLEEGAKHQRLPSFSDFCSLHEKQPFDRLRATGKFKATATHNIALSAVIETKSGTKSYWALTHPPGKPDFHHADCFIGAFAATDHP